jgi:hypothetical protein
MKIMKIIDSTDGQFLGMNVDLDGAIVFSGTEFVPDKTMSLPNGALRLSNSNYSIDLVEDQNGKNFFAQFTRRRNKPNNRRGQ